MIYQIYYDEKHIPFLDKAYEPFDNSAAFYPDLCEFGVIKELYDKQLHKKYPLLGTVSWKFSNKTHISGKKFIHFIQKNPGYDVYFINPYPHLEHFKNVWEQGQNQGHTKIIEYTQNIFNDLEYPIDLRQVINRDETTSYCNYWVGTSDFWEQYMAFLLPIHDYIFYRASDEFKDKLLRQPAHKDYKQPYFPFIFERLFSTFLCINKQIRYQKYAYNMQELFRKYDYKNALYYYIKSKWNGVQ